MPDYSVVISRAAQKQLDKLSDVIAAPILEAIEGLANNPRPHGYTKLRGREGYRIRSGNYRILYDIADRILTVEVVAVGHRSSIYE